MEMDDIFGSEHTVNLRRSKTTKTVTSVSAPQGRFAVTIPVSKELLKDADYTSDHVFTHTQYSAITCEPNEFPGRYPLRHKQDNIKVALVVTMYFKTHFRYNEDDQLFVKSMMAVAKNIAYLCSDACPFSWGKDGWKSFVTVIVSDGRQKINQRTLTVLQVLGVYVDGLCATAVDGKNVQAHLFEFTTQIAVDRDFKIRRRSDGIRPMQCIFLLKEKNAKKVSIHNLIQINSHKWFFEAICETLKPEVCLLLDVGTKPSETSFYHLYRAFERDENVGGACGEIVAEIGKVGKNLLNPLVATQNFEVS